MRDSGLLNIWVTYPEIGIRQDKSVHFVKLLCCFVTNVTNVTKMCWFRSLDTNIFLCVDTFYNISKRKMKKKDENAILMRISVIWNDHNMFLSFIEMKQFVVLHVVIHRNHNIFVYIILRVHLLLRLFVYETVWSRRLTRFT